MFLRKVAETNLATRPGQAAAAGGEMVSAVSALSWASIRRRPPARDYLPPSPGSRTTAHRTCGILQRQRDAPFAYHLLAAAEPSPALTTSSSPRLLTAPARCARSSGGEPERADRPRRETMRHHQAGRGVQTQARSRAPVFGRAALWWVPLVVGALQWPWPGGAERRPNALAPLSTELRAASGRCIGTEGMEHALSPADTAHRGSSGGLSRAQWLCSLVSTFEAGVAPPPLLEERVGSHGVEGGGSLF